MTPKLSYIIDRILHWVSAFTILFLLFDMGTRIHNVDYRIKGEIEHKQDAIELHVSIAFLLLLTIFCRIIWRKFFLDEKFQTRYKSRKHRWLVNSVHVAMYSTIFLMMISGLFMINNYEHPIELFNLIELSKGYTEKFTYLSANNWHLNLESILYSLIFLHFIGAIYHNR